MSEPAPKRPWKKWALVALGAFVAFLVLGNWANAAFSKHGSQKRGDEPPPLSSSNATPTLPSISSSAPNAPSSTRADQPPNRPAGYVSDATWTDGPWPFTVPEGTLLCAPYGVGGRSQSVTFIANGVVYAINGTAKGTHQFAPLEQIWKDNPQMAGTKVNIGPMLDRGLSLCRTSK
jgi:Protein of unknown function (DUF2511)